MPGNKKRNLLFLNSMSFEMMNKQGRIWEVKKRGLGGYCEKSCSVFLGTGEEKIVEIEPGRNICYCLRNPSLEMKMSLFRHLHRAFFFVSLTLRLRSICKKNNIDAIVSQSNALREVELASLVVSKLRGIPMLGYIGRNYTALKTNKNLSDRIVHQIESTILSLVDRVIMRPASEEILSKYYNIDYMKIVTIPHMTKFHEFNGSSEILEPLNEWILNRRLILYYGRLEDDKLIEDMIRSFHSLIENTYNICFLLIGFGQDKPKYENLAGELGIIDSIRFEPSMSQEDLAIISKRADIIIHPTGGKGLLESAVLGKPVITYDSHSYDYGLVEHMKTGLKAKFRSVQSLAECISKYLESWDLGLRLGEALKDKALALSDSSAVCRKFSSAIEKAIIDNRNKKRFFFF